MPHRKLPNDKHQILDLWAASRPAEDERILAFTVNFSDAESIRLKALKEKYITAAHRTVQRLLAKANPIDVIVVLERNGRRRSTLSGPKTGLHAHGWIRVKESVTANELKKIMKKTQSNKFADGRAFSARDDNLRTKLDVDSGWPVYLSKEFGHLPKGCTRPAHWFSATDNTRKQAAQIRSKRAKAGDMRELTFEMREEYIQQLQRKGDWKNWHKSFNYYHTVSE